MSEPQSEPKFGNTNEDWPEDPKEKVAWKRLFGLDPKQPANDKIALRLKQAFLLAVTEKDVTEITEKMVAVAKAGDVRAAEMIFERLFGKTIRPVVAAAVQQDAEDEHAEWLKKLDSRVVGVAQQAAKDTAAGPKLKIAKETA